MEALDNAAPLASTRQKGIQRAHLSSVAETAGSRYPVAAQLLLWFTVMLLKATPFIPVLLALGACSAAPLRIQTASLQRSFDLEPEPSLRSVEVFAYHGSVTIETGAEFSGQVLVDVTAADINRTEAIADAVLLSREENSPGRLSLAVDPPIGASLDHIQVSYSLTVPAKVEIRIVTLDASVSLNSFAGVASVRTDSGRIRSDMRNGSCELTTRSGPIELLGDYASGVISSQSGKVMCRTPQPGGQLSIACVDGSATLAIGNDDPIQFAFDTASGSVHSALSVNLIERVEKGRHIFIGSRGDAQLSARAQITSMSAPLHIVSRVSMAPGSPRK